MTVVKSRLQNSRRQKGQATTELVILLPLLMALIVWLFMGFRSLRASHVAQRAAYANLMMRLDNRASPAVDGLGTDGLDYVLSPENRYFMAVRHLPATGQGSQDGRYFIRLDDGGMIGTGSTDAPRQEYTTAVGVCFYVHDRCNRY